MDDAGRESQHKKEIKSTNDDDDDWIFVFF